MDTILNTVMNRDNLSREEVEDMIAEAKEECSNIMENGGGILALEQVVEDYFGLEPDYLDELIDIY